MKKILLVGDQPGWIFDRHCQEIKKRLPEFKIDIVFRRFNIKKVENDYDLIYVLDPIPLKYGYPSKHKTIIGLRCEFLYLEHPLGAKGLYENGWPGRCASIKDKCKIFHVVNRNQMDIFSDIVVDKSLVLAQHGVDETIFNRTKYNKQPSDVLRVSTSGRGSRNKGFGIVSRACSELGIHNISAEYGNRKFSKEQMPEFYNNADVHVCMSKTEGLNNPIMEAGAMGLPVISTRCGAAEEMIEDGVNGFLINRDVDSLKEALIKMKDYNLRANMADRFYEEIMTNWTWKVRIEDFRKMFNLFFTYV